MTAAIPSLNEVIANIDTGSGYIKVSAFAGSVCVRVSNWLGQWAVVTITSAAGLDELLAALTAAQAAALRQQAALFEEQQQ